MARTSDSYDAGKDGEAQTWDFLRSRGYCRPTPAQRRNIADALEARGTAINERGFDAFHEDFLPVVDSVDALKECHERIKLYEVKTCGANRRAEVSPGFRGLGFTLTRKEVDNALLLGSQYRFLFVNLRTHQYRECALEDFFNTEHSRVYETWSVFLTRELPEADSPREPLLETLHHIGGMAEPDFAVRSASDIKPQLGQLFLHLCCEGWFSVGPFQWLSFVDDMSKVVDSTGKVIAQRSGGEHGWHCSSAPEMVFSDLAISLTRRHPLYP